MPSRLHPVLLKLAVALTCCVIGFLAGRMIGSLLLSRENKNLSPPLKEKLPSTQKLRGVTVFAANLDPDLKREAGDYEEEDSTLNLLASWPWPETERYIQSLEEPWPKLYIVTPTVRGPTQIPDLVRLAQALLPFQPILTWLIYEDRALTEKSFPDHLNILRKNLGYFIKEKDMDIRINWSFVRDPNEGTKRYNQKTKGIEARLAALAYLRKHAKPPGVVFFADDDNTYDTDLFRQILHTKRVSSWPVGLLTNLQLGTLVAKDSAYYEVYDGYRSNRRFPMDFAGFAVNLDAILENPKATFTYMPSYQETWFLSSLGLRAFSEIEPLGNGGTEVLAYHTRTTCPVNCFDNQDTSPEALELMAALSDLENTNIPDLFEEYKMVRSRTHFSYNITS